MVSCQSPQERARKKQADKAPKKRTQNHTDGCRQEAGFLVKNTRLAFHSNSPLLAPEFIQRHCKNGYTDSRGQKKTLRRPPTFSNDFAHLSCRSELKHLLLLSGPEPD